MSRTYTCVTENVSLTAAQDLAQIKNASGSNKMLRIKRCEFNVTDSSPAASQMLRFRARLLPATVTDGSGGTTPTPQPLDHGDVAATFSALMNNTTQATTSGTASVLWADGAFLLSGVDEVFIQPPTVAPAQSFVFELLNAPTGTVHGSTTITVEEIG